MTLPPHHRMFARIAAREIGRFPTQVAEAQGWWEVRHAVRRAHLAGASIRELSEFSGTSETNIRSKIRVAERDLEQGRPSPIEKYLSEEVLEAAVVAAGGRAKRRRSEALKAGLKVIERAARYDA